MNHLHSHLAGTANGSHLAGSHDFSLVIVSVLIAVLSALSALELANRVSSASRATKAIWIAGGAVSLGIGIWSMHFTAMLAFKLPVPVTYHIPTVIFSLAPAIVGSAGVLALVTVRTPSLWRVAFGAIAAGISICTMHYSGMAAIRAQVTQRYDLRLVGLSLLVATAIVFVALHLLLHFRSEVRAFTSRKLYASLFMGLAIPIMHYVGMAAVTFSPDTRPPDLSSSVDISGVGGIAIMVGSLIILGFTILTTYVDRLFTAQNQKLEYQAGHDSLTGLVNRFLMQDRIQQALLLADRRRVQVGVFAVDLDGFKRINDTLGHDAGDEVLRQVSNRLRHVVRGSDTVARIGGDEFLIVLNGINSGSECIPLAARCLEVIRQPIDYEGKTYSVSGSIGISLYPDHSRNAEELVRQADAAMYIAKGAGKNKWELFTSEINSVTQVRNSITAALMNALTNDEFHLHYQPQYRADGKLLGFEALLRWSNPQLGNVSPATFIPLAEELGLIMPIGEWVLKAACADLKRWRVSGHSDIRISVNVSALQFEREDWMNSVINTLADYGIPTSCLEFELTESVVLKNSSEAIRRLQQIRALGITTAIDDFGTGYSALKYLQDLPVDCVKIDRSFVARLTEADQRHAGAIVKTITHLAHNLGLSVVAEGVEKSAEMEFLRSIGCDAMQGYLLAKPMPTEQVEHLLSARSIQQGNFSPLLTLSPCAAG